MIKTSEGCLITNCYKKKPTWFGRYLNYDSYDFFRQEIVKIEVLLDGCIIFKFV